jgi:hypothetical protein
LEGGEGRARAFSRPDFERREFVARFHRLDGLKTGAV